VEQRRLGELLGMDVYDGGQRLGRVQDMRVVPRRTESRLVARSLIVGRGRPGSFLGYERGGVIGPALVRTAVRRLHRHTGELAMDLVEEIDWESSRVAARGPLAALSGARVADRAHPSGADAWPKWVISDVNASCIPRSGRFSV
jgi:sporulation protein YlmC with PRC-barrel domain